MRAVDTKVLVRILIRDDEVQAAAAERFVAGGAWVPLVALVEAIWVLGTVYEVPPSRLADALEFLLDHETLVLEEVDVVEGALGRFRLHPKLGFADCLVVECAVKAGHTPLGTFDRSLAKQPGAELIRPLVRS